MSGIELTALLLAAASPNPELANLQAFEFQGLVAGEQLPEKELRGCRKERDTGEQVCLKFRSFAGIFPEFLSLHAYEGRMSMFLGQTKRSDYTTLRDAFKAKYGEPCKTDTQDWQSRMGVKITGESLTWCFSTGKLNLNEVGTHIDKSAFIYQDDWQPPKAAPKVDF